MYASSLTIDCGKFGGCNQVIIRCPETTSLLPNNLCTINSVTGQSHGLYNSVIYAETTDVLHLNCKGYLQCSGSTLNANNANEVNILCDSRDNGYYGPNDVSHNNYACADSSFHVTNTKSVTLNVISNGL